MQIPLGHWDFSWSYRCVQSGEEIRRSQCGHRFVNNLIEHKLWRIFMDGRHIRSNPLIWISGDVTALRRKSNRMVYCQTSILHGDFLQSKKTKNIPLKFFKYFLLKEIVSSNHRRNTIVLSHQNVWPLHMSHKPPVPLFQKEHPRNPYIGSIPSWKKT